MSKSMGIPDLSRQQRRQEQRVMVKKGAAENRLSSTVADAVQEYINSESGETFLTTLLSAYNVINKTLLDLQAIYTREFIDMSAELERRQLQGESDDAIGTTDQQLESATQGEGVGLRADEGREDDPVVASGKDV